MSNLIIDQIVVNNKTGLMEFGNEYLLLKLEDFTLTIQKNEFRTLEVFKSIKNYCLRICSADGKVIDILNISENDVNKIRREFNNNFGLEITSITQETLCTTDGNLIISNNSLACVTQDKLIFSVPTSNIVKVAELHNDVVFTLDEGTELTFATTSKVTESLQNKLSKEACIAESLACVYPRTKANLMFYDNYFEFKGSSYDHKIFYDNITDILCLSKVKDKYLVIKLSSPILQGQTKYEDIVFALTTDDVQIAAKHPKLKDYNSGEQCDVILEILTKISGKPYKNCEVYFDCNNKVNLGHLFVTSGFFQFVPKPISIPLNTIQCIEIQRLTLNSGQLKTFDITISADKAYFFTHLNRDRFGELEDFCEEHHIKMVVAGEDGYEDESFNKEEESSDISGVILDSEESQ
ncbi:POB3 [Hepatospora eriocheir]|uniref:POB3 n=1 Tax=Hepatospora eriocheir TaxID=1081669 RepID=A0A1X0QIC9_9MICR|nr:POB3 [Hepatospora eriocheir]